MSWLDQQRGALAQSVLATLKAHAVHNRPSLPPFRLSATAQQILNGLQGFPASGEPAQAIELGKKLAEQGLGLLALLAVNRMLLRAAVAPSDPPLAPTILAERVATLSDYLTALVEGMTAIEVQVLTVQRDQMQAAIERATLEQERALRSVIRDLSTPIIPVFENVIVLPLVGDIDHERSLGITERLLEAVVAHRAKVAIIDVTGVPKVDRETVNALVRAAQSARLLGTHPVLAGIRPDIAVAMTKLGADLEGITTHADLQRGLEYALCLKGLIISKKPTVSTQGRER